MKSVVLTLSTSGLLIVFCGCASTRPDFLIGIYKVPAAEMRAVRGAGFNFVVGPADAQYLESAKRCGLTVLAAPAPAWTRRHLNVEQIQQIRKLDAHSALQGWYLFDEPDLNLVAPDEVV